MPTNATVSSTTSTEPLVPDGLGPIRRPVAGLLTLGVLGLAFCALPAVAWAVSGHWVPEAMVFGLAMVVVGGVSQTR